MITPVALACLLLLPQEAQEDVVHLTDGSKRAGIIVAETDEAVTLQLLMKGERGETIGTIQVDIQRGEIARIDRAPEEARNRALGRAKAFDERERRRIEALEKIRVRPSKLRGTPALETSAIHFDLKTTGDETLLREVRYYLDEQFEGYRKHFRVRSEAGARIQIYLFSGRDEYMEFQRSTLGLAVENPAFYSLQGNFIAAYDMIQKDEAGRIRKEVLASEEVIRDLRRRLAAAEEKVEDLVRRRRQDVIDRAAQLKETIRKGPAEDKPARLAEVDRWKESELAALKKAEAEAARELRVLRRAAAEALETNRRVIAKNHGILARRNSAMYETLFHEAFHAFARNFLWGTDPGDRVPLWLDEGMASYFEISAFEAGGLVHGAPNAALVKILQEDADRGRRLSLERILRAGSDVFRVEHPSQASRSNSHYAGAWAVCHYLAARVSRDELSGYVDDVLAGGDSVSALEKMTGKKLAEVEAEVRRHVAGLK